MMLANVVCDDARTQQMEKKVWLEVEGKGPEHVAMYSRKGSGTRTLRCRKEAGTRRAHAVAH